MSGMLLTMMIIVAGFVTVTPDTTRFRLPPPGRGTVDIHESVVRAALGPCSAELSIRDASGHPVDAANIHLVIRHGFMGVRRVEVDVDTHADGTLRVEGLPDKAALIVYDIAKGDAVTHVYQDSARLCRARYDVTLK